MTRTRRPQEERQALSTFVKLIRAADAVSASVHSALAAENLTISQFAVLEALLHLGPMRQRDLAGKILRTAGNLTMVIDNLEKQGLVVRQQNQTDRRSYSIELTDSGRQRIEAIFPAHAERIRQRMAVLSAKEQRELARLCRTLGRVQTYGGQDVQDNQGG